jgi:hypothetical protein
MSNQLSYDARQVTSQGAQKTAQRAALMLYDAVKWVVNFIGDMIRIALGR